jgi:predicted N-acetyltransferase YhbS
MQSACQQCNRLISVIEGQLQKGVAPGLLFGTLIGRSLAERDRMRIAARCYCHGTDYQRIGQFLLRTYQTTGDHINWLQPRWEYMHYHPFIREVDLSLIGIWEAGRQIVGVVHPEHHMGTAYFEVDPAHAVLKMDMLEYAEGHLAAMSDGAKALSIYINDSDHEFQHSAAKMGYEKSGGYEEMSRRVISDPFPVISLPQGFRLKSLADDNDLQKVHRVLWRGFDHEGEPPEEGVEDRKFMQSAPNFREDLNIVVEAPDGEFVSYCGMWYEPVHRIAYVEPVATDPEFRGMGLGRAAVLEGVRRCGNEGATVSYVGTAIGFYLSIGFERMYRLTVWQRKW